VPALNTFKPNSRFKFHKVKCYYLTAINPVVL